MITCSFISFLLMNNGRGGPAFVKQIVPASSHVKCNVTKLYLNISTLNLLNIEIIEIQRNVQLLYK